MGAPVGRESKRKPRTLTFWSGGDPVGDAEGCTPAQKLGQLLVLQGAAALPQRLPQLAQGHGAAPGVAQFGQRLPDVFVMVLQPVPEGERVLDRTAPGERIAS